MVKIDIVYEGDLRCRLKHGPSGDQIKTDAPIDNMGKGEAFSPTDLVAAALGSCMLTVMGIAARKHNINLNGSVAEVQKEMVTAPVRRIEKLSVVLNMAPGISLDKRAMLERAALNCPVHKSLNPDVEIPIVFNWQ